MQRTDGNWWPHSGLGAMNSVSQRGHEAGPAPRLAKKAALRVVHRRVVLVAYALPEKKNSTQLSRLSKKPKCFHFEELAYCNINYLHVQENPF